MGQIHLERDGPMAAVPWVDQLVNLSPQFSPGLNLWAWVYAEQGRSLDVAEARSRQALAHQPRTGSYWDTLGWVMMQQDKAALALPILERAVRLSPNDDDVLARRDSCRSSLGGARQ